MRMNIMERARAIFQAEADVVYALQERVDERFVRTVDLLLGCPGHVITTGVGKAGIPARKMAATLASTGTPALFLHPAEGVHGDLGVVASNDVVIVFSYSGESEEVLRLLPSLKRIGPSIIAMVGNPRSTLAQAATIVLDVSVATEACPLDLAPTTSVVAMLALGDALALCAMEARGFTKEDFALYHPAGAIGRRLTLKVADVMRTGEQMAVTPAATSLRDVLFAITKAGAGAAFLVDAEERLVGMITDGDVRRALLKDPQALEQPAEQIMNPQPLVISGNLLAVEALTIFEESPRRPGEAPVVDAGGRPIGLLMLKDLLRAGIV